MLISATPLTPGLWVLFIRKYLIYCTITSQFKLTNQPNHFQHCLASRTLISKDKAVCSHTSNEVDFLWDFEPNGHLSIHSVIAVLMTRGHYAVLLWSSANISQRETCAHSCTVQLILSKWTTKDPNNVYWATCIREAPGKDSEFFSVKPACFFVMSMLYYLRCFT